MEIIVPCDYPTQTRQARLEYARRAFQFWESEVRALERAEDTRPETIRLDGQRNDI